MSIILLLFLFPFESGAAKEDYKKDYVLVINSYTDDAPWSAAILTPLRAYVDSDVTTAFFLENLNLLMVRDSVKLNKIKSEIFNRYDEAPPKVLVILGNSALLFLNDIKEHWGDIPVILCGEDDFYGSMDVYLKKLPILPEERRPISELTEKYNLTFLQSKLYPEENVRLMRYMIPGMKKVVLIGDQRQVNQQLNYDMKALLNDKFQGLDYEFLSAENVTTDELLKKLKKIDIDTTGVLFSSWFSMQPYDGNMVLHANAYKIIANAPVPVFTLKNVVLDNSGMIGGCVYDYKKYTDKVIQSLISALSGTPARKIPFYIPGDPEPIFYYPSLIRQGFTVDDCPPDSIFMDRPENFIQRYKYAIAFAIVFVIFIFIYMQVRFKALKVVQQAQQKQLEVSAELDSLFDTMPIVYVKEKLVRDDAGKITDVIMCDVNSSFRSLFPETDIVGYKGSELIIEGFHKHMQFLELLGDKRKTITFNQYLQKFDIYLDIVLTFAANREYVHVFCVESTSLYRAQEQLNATNRKLALSLEVANVIPWKWDIKNHTILCDVNRPIELNSYCMGVDAEQLAVPEEEYFSKIHKDDLERVKLAYRNLIEGRTEKVCEEYQVLSFDPTGRRLDWVEARATVYKYDDSGNPWILIGSSQVITERKQIEHELLVAKNKAEESNRLKSAFLANMSHEIRTPLNAIVGFSGLLSSVEDPSEKNEYMDIIENNNSLLLQLIGDILDLSKIESDTLDFSVTDVDINKLLEELENSLRLRIETEDVILRFHAGLEKCCVRTEQNRLSQVIINLVNNAIKFTQKGSIDFGYEIKGDEFYFYVKDTGRGIPEDKVSSIFERFVKLDQFTQGTGLGLPICRTIVERMGGTVGVESEYGKGSMFWFTWPYSPISVVKKTELNKPVKMVKDKLNILIAEDNIFNYKLLASILKSDYNLLSASNGQEAVDIFRDHRPDIILMDLNMPVMDGYEATRLIREMDENVPIIAITAFAYASDRERVIENGFDDYMAKPIKAEKLKMKLAEIINSRILFI